MVLLFAIVLVGGWMNSIQKVSPEATKRIESASKKGDNQSFMLSDFPSEIELAGMDEIESMKFFVNDDVSSGYLFGGPVNYYNVVYSTSLPRAAVFAAYRDSMNVDEEESSDSKILGTIGEYLVSVSQYEEDSDTVYVQAVLPLESFEKENPYFTDYPELIEVDPTWIEKESSYGLLNQKGGEVEYWQYFILNEDELPAEMSEQQLTDFYQEYSEMLQEKTDFVADDETQKLTWTDGEYSVTMTFSNDHGRVYVMIRKSM